MKENFFHSSSIRKFTIIFRNILFEEANSPLIFTYLTEVVYRFLINMFYAFSDYENLYLVTDLVTSGDMRYHLSKRKKFTEPETKFFLACILIGLEYMHNNGVIHRDIKPENLLLDEKGYVHITDMGISRMWSPDNAHDTSGTPGYMAPEVMCR